MDANGTRFHLLLGRDDWARCVDRRRVPLRECLDAGTAADGADAPTLEWDAARQHLRLRARHFNLQPTRARRDGLAPDARRGAARDRHGNWYWIGENGRDLLALFAGSTRPAPFWPAPTTSRPTPRVADGRFRACPPPSPPEVWRLCGLAVTEDHYLAVGVREPVPGLLLFDLHGSGGPRLRPWPRGVPFAPWDMAARPGGGLWVLDRDNARLWALDRRFQLADPPDPPMGEPAPFQPSDLSGEPRRLPVPSCADGTALGIDTVAVEAMPDGSALLLVPEIEPGFAGVRRFADGELQGPAASTAVVLSMIEPGDAGTFTFRGHDMALVTAGDETADGGPRLVVVGSGGDQAVAFRLTLRPDGAVALEGMPDYLPMRLFGGRALAAAGGQVFYDSGTGPRWLALAAQPRPRFAEAATFYTFPLDGGEPGCVWHRLMLDTHLPPETSVEVWSAADDDPLALLEPPEDEASKDETGDLEREIAWRREPQPRRRTQGSELPFLGGPAARCYPTHETLFQRARGRYLRLKLVLRGNGRATPRLRALRAWYPRFSYLGRYLPAVYREDPDSAFFLDRFLANAEGILTGIEDRTAAIQLLFDPRSAPSEALDWLAGWFGLALDPGWDEGRRRLLLRHAAALFAVRGTVRGLQLALHLALDACVDEDLFTGGASAAEDPFRIVEGFRGLRLPPALLGLTGDAVPAAESAGPVVAAGTRWRPDQGGEDLHRRYREALGLGPGERFPTVPPGDDTRRDAWAAFARDTLGFVPERPAVGIWRAFLARRYRNVGALNGTYGTRLDAIEVVEVPEALPPDGAPLHDWVEFQGVVLARRRVAHRFTVMLPVRPAERADLARRIDRQALARRVVELEKPTHTTFDVRFYWAMFRVGEARLGRDTAIDRGSRAPELMPPLVLGGSHLGEAFLTPGHPWDVRDRLVVGRDRVGGAVPLGGP